MKKLTIPAAFCAAAMLSACVSIPETRVVGTADVVYMASTGPIIVGAPVRPGAGRVVHPMSSTTVVDGVANQVVTMNMRDGTKQTLVVSGSQLKTGESVVIRADNSIARDWHD